MEVSQPQLSVEELHFALYQRALHPELFNIAQVRRLQQRRYSAEVWLIGLGHVVTVQFGNHYLTELVAHHNELLPRAGLANTFKFRGERDFSQSFPSGMKYILSSQVERMSANLFPSTYRDMVGYGQRRAMYAEFDDLAGDGPVPFSILDSEARDGEFHVHAFHVFPSERTIVKTQSIVEIERRATSSDDD